MRLVKFGLYDLPTYSAEDGFDLRTRGQLVPVGSGSYDAAPGSFRLEPQQVTRRFELLAGGTATITEEVEALSAEVGRGLRILRAKTRDGDDRQSWARCTNLSLAWNAGQPAYQPVDMSLVLPYPLWADSADERDYLDDGLLLDDGWTLDGGSAETTTIAAAVSAATLTYTNGGGVASTRGRLLVMPQAGASLSKVTVINETTGHQLTFAGTVTATEHLAIDLDTQTVLLGSSDAYSGLSKPSSQLEFMRFARGANTIRIETTGQVGSVDISLHGVDEWLL